MAYRAMDPRAHTYATEAAFSLGKRETRIAGIFRM
jgi:hypothetical protein